MRRIRIVQTGTLGLLCAVLIVGGCVSPRSKNQATNPFMDQAIVPPPATGSYVGQSSGYVPPGVPAVYQEGAVPASGPVSTVPAGSLPSAAPTGFAPINPPLSVNGETHSANAAYASSVYSATHSPAPLVLGQTDPSPQPLPATFRSGTFLQSSETNILPVAVTDSAKVTTNVE